MPSQMRNSTVPKVGCGRMSHHTSRIDSMALAETSVSMKSSNSDHPASWYGRPAVGRDSKTLERLEARPGSWAIQDGSADDRAGKVGMKGWRGLALAIDFSA